MQAISRIADLSSRPVQDFVTEPITASIEDSVSEVIGKVASKRLYEIFIPHNSGFGVVTLRSILQAGEIFQTKLSRLAVIPPVIMLNDPVSKAAKSMSGLRVQSLPVTDPKYKLQGAIASVPILQELAKLGSSSRSVGEIMTSRAITLEFSDSLDKAVSLMVENGIDHLPVTHEGRFEGVVTSLDIAGVLGSTDRTGVSRVSEPSSRGHVRVGGLVKEEPVVCKPTDDSYGVLKKILGANRTAATIMVADVIQGIVTLTDYLKLLIAQPESEQLPVYVVGLRVEDFESYEAESKFRRSIEVLGHVYKIEEARATVKTSSNVKERRRFEVRVLIRAQDRQFDFEEEGWSIEEVFEKIGEKIKRLMTKPRSGRSHRRHPSREEAESERYAE